MADPEIERVKRIARLLDVYMVDPLLGFFLPGLGDLIGSLFGLYAVSLAVRRKMSGVIIARMVLNLSLDAAMGALPIIGDAVDFAFKANEYNVALLERGAERGGKASWRDWAVILGSIALCLAVLFAVIFVMVRLILWILHA